MAVANRAGRRAAARTSGVGLGTGSRFVQRPARAPRWQPATRAAASRQPRRNSNLAGIQVEGVDSRYGRCESSWEVTWNTRVAGAGKLSGTGADAVLLLR